MSEVSVPKAGDPGGVLVFLLRALDDTLILLTWRSPSQPLHHPSNISFRTEDGKLLLIN